MAYLSVVICYKCTIHGTDSELARVLQEGRSEHVKQLSFKRVPQAVLMGDAIVSEVKVAFLSGHVRKYIVAIADSVSGPCLEIEDLVLSQNTVQLGENDHNLNPRKTRIYLRAQHDAVADGEIVRSEQELLWEVWHFVASQRFQHQRVEGFLIHGQHSLHRLSQVHQDLVPLFFLVLSIDAHYSVVRDQMDYGRFQPDRGCELIGHVSKGRRKTGNVHRLPVGKQLGYRVSTPSSLPHQQQLTMYACENNPEIELVEA